MKSELINKIDQKEFVVGIIGLGYVGLPILYNFAEHGFRTIGFDIDEAKVKSLQDGESYIQHISTERVRSGLASGRVEVTSDYAGLSACDGIIITVPTPLTAHREPDISFIVDTAQSISRHLHVGQLVILESTTYPGTTEEVVVPILERSGLKVDRDFYVAYSPEREDPNNKTFATGDIPKVVGATSEDGLAVAERLYSEVVVRTVPVSSIRVAEASKLLENIFRAVNIALVNELKVAFMKMDIDIWEVIEAAATKPFGFMPFYPGPGLGGHCIPIDPFYLSWKAREYGIFTRFIELAGEINTAMPDFVVTRVMEVLNAYGKPLKDARILILGLAYKPNVDDARESPTYDLMSKLERMGALVSYNDPFIPLIGASRKFSALAGRTSVDISADYDLMLIATAHDQYASVDFQQYGVPILDTRNLLTGDSELYHKA